MLATRNAGGAVHHWVLLWPLPHAIIALAFGAVWQRYSRTIKGLVAIGVAIVVTSNVLVINEFYTLALRNGGTPRWSDAIYDVSGYLRSHPAKSIVLLDWGLLGPLRVLNQGALPLELHSGILQDTAVPMPQWEEFANGLIRDPGTVFLTNLEPAIPGADARLSDFAARLGLTRTSVNIFKDGHGVPMIELFRYTPPSERETNILREDPSDSGN